MLRWDGHVARKGQKKDVLGEDVDRKPRSPDLNMGEDNIKTDL